MSPQIRVLGFSWAAATVLILPAFGQTATTAPPTTTTTTPTASTTTTTPTRSIPTNTTLDPNNGNNPAQQRPTPIMITGRVMLEDGTPPPSTAVIERLCNGSPHSEGYTDSKGYFSIELGQNLAALGDASESGSGYNQTFPNFPSAGIAGPTSTTSARSPGRDTRFSNCEIRARLGGYRSQSVSLFNHNALENPDIGVILMHRLGPAETATTVTASSLTAPKPARKAYEKGLELGKKKKTEEAIASMQEAVNLHPPYASAWYALGKLQTDQGQAEQARASFEAAAKAEPRWPEPFLELSLIAVRAKDWKSVAELTDHVLRLNSFDYPQEYFFNAVAQYNLRHLDAAEKSVRAAQRLDTRHLYPQTSHLLGAILIDRHDYAAAAEELRTYLTLAPKSVDAAAIRKQLDDVEQLALSAPQVAAKEPR